MGAFGGWHWALYVAGYIGAAFTAVYTFRLIFRAFWGEPCKEAKELQETGKLAHMDPPRNPADDSVEDTDVGFPGPEHHVAEKALPMKLAMGVLAVLATVSGALQIPGVTSVITNFLRPTFVGSSTYNVDPSAALTIFGMIFGTVIALGGIAYAYWLWVKRPGTSAKLIVRFKLLYELFHGKWFFDEAIAFLVIRPFAWFGRFSQQTFERIVVNGVFVGGSTAVVRASSAAVRAVQNGLLRNYAALMLAGVAVVAIYFLLDR